MKITAAVAAAAIAQHFAPTTNHADRAAVNAAVTTMVRSAALVGDQTPVQTNPQSVRKAISVTLTAAQLQTEMDKLAAVLIALKPLVSYADVAGFNAAMNAYSAALQA